MARQDGKANLGEVRQLTDEDGFAQASAEFRLACATDSIRLLAWATRLLCYDLSMVNPHFFILPFCVFIAIQDLSGFRKGF